MLSWAKSFTAHATRRSCRFARTWRITVVLPLPSQPVTSVVGNRRFSGSANTVRFSKARYRFTVAASRSAAVDDAGGIVASSPFANAPALPARDARSPRDGPNESAKPAEGGGSGRDAASMRAPARATRAKSRARGASARRWAREGCAYAYPRS